MVHDCTILRRLRWWRAIAAVVGGGLASASFSPLEWSWAAFLAMVPLLALPFPRRHLERLAIGGLFGYVHFATLLHWLNAVGFGAGWLLAGYCALFPMAWYWLAADVAWRLKPVEVLKDGETAASPPHCPGAPLLPPGAGWRMQLLAGVAPVAGWTALEWLRGWLFTGFPWAILGTSQAFNPLTRQCVSVAGPYGLGTAIMAVNAGIAAAIVARRKWWRQPLWWTAVAALAAVLLHGVAVRGGASAQPAGRTLTVMAVQGDLPECRSWDYDLFEYSWQRYSWLTLDGLARAGRPIDLAVWPEGALPCAIGYHPYARNLQALLRKMDGVPLLLGAIDLRPKNFQVLLKPGFDESDCGLYNSAFLLTASSPLLANASTPLRSGHYDKIHLVPFGEYVPFSRYFPWLPGLIGMGRDMTAGGRYTLFKCAGARFGVSICFEDAFPGIPRRFMQDGADFLVTITNDCWYPFSAEARQHLAHAVMRAVENRVPLLRSGNNSDTCLILPDGSITGVVRDRHGGQYGAGTGVYNVPVAGRAGLSPYCRFGDWAAWLCLMAAIAVQAAACRHRRTAVQKK